MKTTDHLHTDPHADELVLRHRLHSGASYTSQQSVPSPKRPTIKFIVSVMPFRYRWDSSALHNLRRRFVYLESMTISESQEHSQ